MVSPRASRPSADVEGETRIGFRMAGIGFEVASEVAAGALIGWGIGHLVGSPDKGVLIGGLIGIAVAMWTLIHRTMKLNRELDRTHPTAGRGTPIPYEDDDDDRDDHD